jgi:hypothetical protein
MTFAVMFIKKYTLKRKIVRRAKKDAEGGEQVQDISSEDSAQPPVVEKVSADGPAVVEEHEAEIRHSFAGAVADAAETSYAANVKSS